MYQPEEKKNILHSLERQDTYQNKGRRKALVALLKEKGIKDAGVLQAIESIPRQFFLDPAFEHYAYEDRAFQIGAGQTISQPFTVAHQTEQLQVQRFDKVLEIGTGSAYQSCVLTEMGAQVYTIERQKELYQYIDTFFFIKKYPSIKRFYGDGYKGLPTYAPFDKIIVTAAASHIPDALLHQLKPGGRMIIPVDAPNGDGQIMILVVKNEDGSVTQTETGRFNFVPMLTGREGD